MNRYLGLVLIGLLTTTACSNMQQDGSDPTLRLNSLSTSSQALTQDHADCLDGDPECTATGAHDKHTLAPPLGAGITCTACHKVGGRLMFDSTSAAYRVGLPAPTFNATNKTCSNVGCHSLPTGTFQYYFQGGDGEPVLNEVVYGNIGNGATLPWYTTGGLAGSCGACHTFPARLANGATPPWHTGAHANNISNGNACQLCHPNVSGAYVYGGSPSYVNTSAGLVTSCQNGTFCSSEQLVITNPSLHANGTVDVLPSFKSACFGCH